MGEFGGGWKGTGNMLRDGGVFLVWGRKKIIMYKLSILKCSE